MIWAFLAIGALLNVVMIGLSLKTVHTRHQTKRLEMEARHARERAELAEWKRQVYASLKIDPSPRSPCLCVNGCKSAWCDK